MSLGLVRSKNTLAAAVNLNSQRALKESQHRVQFRWNGSVSIPSKDGASGKCSWLFTSYILIKTQALLNPELALRDAAVDAGKKKVTG